jgi:hypothetical protein
MDDATKDYAGKIEAAVWEQIWEQNSAKPPKTNATT